MKKLIRVISLIAVFGICLSLCGCSVLDEIRQTRATRTPEGNIKLSDGTEYKLLPKCEELSPSFYEYSEVYVVAEDVPLLLTATYFEDYFDKSDDGKFLVAYPEGDQVHYCRTDVYDTIYQRIMGGLDLETCCYWCYDYDTDRMIPYILTQAQLEAVNQVCLTQEPQTLPPTASMYWDYCVALTMCSEDLLFTKELADICIVEDKYYLVDDSGVDTILYTVPQELTAVFADIMEMYIQTEGVYWNE